MRKPKKYRRREAPPILFGLFGVVTTDLFSILAIAQRTKNEAQIILNPPDRKDRPTPPINQSENPMSGIFLAIGLSKTRAIATEPNPRNNKSNFMIYALDKDLIVGTNP